MKFSLILATAVSANLFAQQVTNPPPPLPLDAPMMLPESASKPAAKPAAKKVAKPAAKKSATKSVAKKTAKAVAKKTAAPEFKSLPLVAGPSVVVASHVNVRTRPGMSGEVLTKLTNGEPILVLEEIKLKHSGPEEPSAWAKIALPATAHAWIKSSYLDANKTVQPKKLNLRGGPSENYGVVGQLMHGDVVTEIENKGEWTQIAPPAGAYAFVAAQYLSQEPAALAAAGLTTPPAVVETTPPPTPTTVPETPAIAAATTETPATLATSEIISNELAAAMHSTVSLAPPPVAEDLPPPPRIVQHEGIVRGNTSIQSPTKYELVSPGDHHLINYLYTTSKNLDLSRYKGLHIIVTGEEGLDERWKFTPIITIQKIQVLE